MESIFASNGDLEIIRNDDNVVILKSWKHFEKIKFTEIKKYQFEDLQEKTSEQDLEEETQAEEAKF